MYISCSKKMSSYKIESYDVSPRTRELIEWRHAKRMELRQKYLKEMMNPIKQSIPVDSAMERYSTLRLHHEFVTKITAKVHVTSFIAFTALIFGGGYLLKKYSNAREHRYRSGYVSYGDREFKFH